MYSTSIRCSIIKGTYSVLLPEEDTKSHPDNLLTDNSGADQSSQQEGAQQAQRDGDADKNSPVGAPGI